MDVLGLVIAVVVLAAHTHENTAGIALLDQVAEHATNIEKALVDQGFKNAVVDHCTTLGIDVEIVERNPQEKGFVPPRHLFFNVEPLVQIAEDECGKSLLVREPSGYWQQRLVGLRVVGPCPT